MKTGLTSLEIHYLVKELEFLEGSRVDNIYNPKKEEIIIQLYAPGKGKQILRVISGKIMYLASSKGPAEEPSGFCMFLRKHLGNCRLKEIRQLGPERIVEMDFEKTDKKKLVIELFGKGNIILCDEEGTVLSALVYHKWKDREIMAKKKYTYPKMEYSFIGLKAKELDELLKGSSKSIVKCLAAELGLGGKYSEEACLTAGIDKEKAASELEDGERSELLKSIKKIVGRKASPVINYEGKEVKDVTPFELKAYEGTEKKEFKSYNDALDHYFMNHLKEEKPKTKQEKEIEKLKRRMEQQEKSIEEMLDKEAEERGKADIIYQNYELINNIILEMREAAKKHGWGEVEKRLKGHKLIKKVNSKDKSIEIEI
ncbi:NFACT family protein [Candidatus Woesearchaeota archaeon]|nr:NFACT family protein [Candidatus Woesearchaeota archaeon]